MGQPAPPAGYAPVAMHICNDCKFFIPDELHSGPTFLEMKGRCVRRKKLILAHAGEDCDEWKDDAGDHYRYNVGLFE